MRIVWLVPVLATGCIHARETVSPKAAITDLGAGWTRRDGQVRPRVAAGLRFVTPVGEAEQARAGGSAGGAIARTVDGNEPSLGLHGTLFGIKIGADVIMHPEARSSSMVVFEGSLATPLMLDPDHDPALDEVSIAGDLFVGVGWKSQYATIAGGPVAGLLEAPIGPTPYLGLALRATTF